MSKCFAKCSPNSFRFPVSKLTTPPGTSEELRTSAKVIALKGHDSEANAITLLPPAITGDSNEINPSSGLVSEATTNTTPVGSSIEKLKWLEATGFTLLKTC